MTSLEQYANALAATGRTSVAWLEYTAAVYASVHMSRAERQRHQGLVDDLRNALSDEERTDAIAIGRRILS